MWSDNSPRFKRYLFCICEAGICDLRPLKKDPNGRFFYKCLTPNCKKGKNNIFKFEHEVDENDVFIDVPNCGDCKGGRCRVARDKEDGPNVGKIVFTCTLKKEQGACKYKVYEDELVVTQQMDPGSVQQLDPGLTLDPIASNGYDDISDADIMDLVMSNEISERGRNYESPVMNTPIHLRSCESSWKMRQMQCQEMELGEFSTAPRKRSRDGEYEGIATLLNSPSAIHAESIVNSGRSTPVTKSPLRPENILPLKEHDQNHVKFVASPNIMSNLPEIRSSSRSPIDRSPNTKVQRINPNIPSQPDSFILGQAAKVLQSELINLLMTMEAKDHESMHCKANAIFPILDGMKIDYQQFKEQIMKLISSAKLLREKEESIPENDYVQKLFNRFINERKKLDEINSAHAKAVDTVENSRNHVEVIKYEISLAKDRLVRAEADLFYSEAQLEKICNEKEVLTGKCDVASQEYEDCRDLQGVIEAERAMAKDAFDRARMSLG